MDPDEGLRRFRVAQRELAAEEVAIKQDAYAMSSSRRVIGLIQQSNAVHRGMRPEEENVQLVSRFYHVAPPPLVFVGDYAKPVFDANALSAMTHASAFNTDEIYRGFGNPNMEAEIALHQGIAAKYKARHIPDITPYGGSYFEAKFSPDQPDPDAKPSPAEVELQKKEAAAAAPSTAYSPAAVARPSTAGFTVRPLRPGAAGSNAAAAPASAVAGAAGTAAAAPASVNLAERFDAAGVQRGEEEQQARPTTVLPAAQEPPPPPPPPPAAAAAAAAAAAPSGGGGDEPPPPPPPEDEAPPPDSPAKIASRKAAALAEAAKAKAAELFANAKAADDAAAKAAREVLQTMLGSPKNYRTRARKASADAAKLEAARLAAVAQQEADDAAAYAAEQKAIADAEDAANAKTRAQKKAAAATVTGGLPPRPPPRPLVAPPIGQQLQGVVRQVKPIKSVSQTVGDFAKAAVAAGRSAAPSVIDYVIKSVVGTAVAAWNATTAETEHEAAIEQLGHEMTALADIAERDGTDITNPALLEQARNSAIAALPPSADDPELFALVLKAVTGVTPSPEKAPGKPLGIFSPAKPEKPADAAAAGAEAPPPEGAQAFGSLAEAEASSARQRAARAAGAEAPPAAAAAAAAAPPAAAAAAAAAAKDSPIRGYTTEPPTNVYNEVLAYFDTTVKNTKGIFNQTKAARDALTAALKQCLKLLVVKIGFPEAKANAAVKYMINTTFNNTALEKPVILRSMIVRSLQGWPQFYEHPRITIPHGRKATAYASLAQIPGEVTGVMGGFGKPMKRPRFEKGSEEAKSYMAELRAKRHKK